MTEYRWKLLAVTTELLLSQPGERCILGVTKTDIPAGAKVVRAYLDDRTGCVMLVLEHPSFEPVPKGQEPPLVYGPWFSKTTEGLPPSPGG